MNSECDSLSFPPQGPHGRSQGTQTSRSVQPRAAHGGIPSARVKIYPDSSHGFLFQHFEEFAADADDFLAADDEPTARRTLVKTPDRAPSALFLRNSATGAAMRPIKRVQGIASFPSIPSTLVGHEPETFAHVARRGAICSEAGRRGLEAGVSADTGHTAQHEAERPGDGGPPD